MMSKQCHCIDPERHGHVDDCLLSELESYYETERRRIEARLMEVEHDAEVDSARLDKKISIGRPDVVTFEPTGYRDVYWCPLINEPYFHKYDTLGKVESCGGCGWDLTKENHEHVFLAHFALNAHIAYNKPSKESRSVQKRIAIQSDKPLPEF